MAREDIETSLEAPSAKIWPREFDDNRNFLFAVQELMVSRWCENEKDTPLKDMWRRSPVGGELKIKGGLIDSDRIEYWPDKKRNRSCQIFKFGFT